MDRKAASSKGGYARAEVLTWQERSAIARSGAAATNSVTSLARRIVKAWPSLGEDERGEVLAILAPLLPRPPKRP